jgi:type IV pilus assembly protein PilY1
MKVRKVLILLVTGFLPMSAIALTLAQSPLSTFIGGTPLVMLVMERDHKLFYEAYNDHADINVDGGLDIRYKPSIDYAGYFDSHKCYTYSTSNNRFEPVETTDDKTCPNNSTAPWSGDFLNYMTTSRIDALRRVLYGGTRSTDSSTETVLERSYIPQDAHSWGKEYRSTTVDGYDIVNYTPLSQPSTGKRHLFANTTLLCPSSMSPSDPGCSSNTDLPLFRVIQNTTFRVWEWVSIERPVAGVQCATGNNSRSNCVISGASLTDYVVRVKACVSGLLEEECQGYPTNSPSVYKPIGLLQSYGEIGKMAFGLMTGSYERNKSGGVLRKDIGPITDEINTSTGQLTSTNGIIKTLDKMKIIGFGGNYYYNDDCQVPEVGGTLSEGRCRMWGNPIAEIMYEGLRYFAAKSSPTSAFTGTDDDATALGLPQPTTWLNPYRTTTGGFPSCSKPSELVISDVTPNFDTDQLPGRHSYTTPTTTPSFTGDLSGMNVESTADSIWASEFGSDRHFFIGQSGNNFDGAPTDKLVTSFGSMRGLAPEEPSQEGGFYAASVANYGKTTDLNTAGSTATCPPGDLSCPVKYQKTDTFVVALSSPLPRIEFPLNVSTDTNGIRTFSNIATIVPFGKTVGGCGSIDKDQGEYQPTNAIVDFYVDTLVNTNAGNTDTSVNAGRPYAKFRINYEDSEYGSDHDMDAIVEYEMTVTSNNSLQIKADSVYAAGGCIQHMGYVISGTNADGTYLVVRDSDTAANNDVDYYLDSPSIGGALPLSSTLNFSSGATAATLVPHDPLWYAAKWGGFIDRNGNDTLDGTEWDNRDGISDGVPDNYFLVTNASQLKEQLERAFIEILGRQGASSAAAVNSTSLQANSRIFQAKYRSLDWSGQLLSFKIDVNGNLDPNFEWDAGVKLDTQLPGNRVIITKVGTDGKAFRYANLTGTSPNPAAGTQKRLFDLKLGSTSTLDNCGADRVAYIRGDQSHEGVSGTYRCTSTTLTNKFRERPKTVLGDLVNSTPLFVGPPAAGYSDVEQAGYGAFQSSSGVVNRKPVVYVGSNDGMLHGFDASLVTSTSVPQGSPTTTAGNEVVAYIPSTMLASLPKLTSLSYNLNHQYFVDGSPMMADIDMNAISSTYTPDWHTMLVSSMGAGGKGIFALDVTTPGTLNSTTGATTQGSFSESDADAANLLLWEFNDTLGDADMGYSISQPAISPLTGQAKQIVRMANGKWALIIGNGYNSTNGKAVLYILFINGGTDGAWTVNSDYIKIVADATTGQDNGLSTPTPFDSNDDGIVDTVYAGDLKGNLWKFLVGPNSSDTSVTSTTSTWKVAYTNTACTTAAPCSPLFKATDGATTPKAQPILLPPEVTLHPNGGQLVLFGTGKFIENNDINNTDVQTFYGIWDKNDTALTRVGVGSTGRAEDLLEQTTTTTTTTAGNFRVPSNNPITWRISSTDPKANCTPAATCGPTHMGWYFNLPTSGERAVATPDVINGVIFFNTFIPPSSTDVCSLPTGWLMALNYESGGLPFFRTIFDTNGTSTIDDSDTIVGGLQIGAALGGTTLIKNSVNTGKSNIGVGVSDLTQGNNPLTTKINFGAEDKGRQSWKEIYN